MTKYELRMEGCTDEFDLPLIFAVYDNVFEALRHRDACNEDSEGWYILEISEKRLD